MGPHGYFAKKLNASQATDLIREVSNEEIKQVIFQMGDDKASGPDGYNDLVDDTQNAFIPGRRISDNILLTQEILKNYHHQIGVPRCAIKVDIKKAYDSVSWDFLIDALKLFGFPEKMIDWIRECISSPSYSIILNGQMHGFFKDEKGLRQGDPLSQYLFTLVMQMF